MTDKQYYEQLIEVSPFFDMNPEKEPVAYEREKDKLAEYVFLYKAAESVENLDYGLEIMETFCRCIKYYNPSKGKFLHYFNRSFMKAKNKAIAQRLLQEKNGGISLSEKEKRKSKEVFKFIKHYGNVSREALLEFVTEFAEQIDMTAEELLEEIKIREKPLVVSEDVDYSGEGNSFSLLESFARGRSITEEIISVEEVRNTIEQCEIAYLKSRKKTQKIISVKLTSIIAEHDWLELYKEIRGKAFFDEEIYWMVKNSGKRLTNRTISQLLNLTEPNLTQIWKRYINRVKKQNI